jgi:hypothetical protein
MAYHTKTLPSNINMSLLTPLQQVIENPHDFLNAELTIAGKVVAVCKERGCWAEMVAGNGGKLRIKVRDGQTVIPMSARGKKAYATGKLTAIELSKEQAILYLEHMAADNGQPFDRASITHGLPLYNLRPTALKIMDN